VPKKLRVGIIFGGRSGEHEVSIRSAQAIIEAINPKKFEVVPVAITKEGKWLGPSQSTQLLPENIRGLLASGTNEQTGDVALLGDPSHKGLIAIHKDNSSTVAEKLDVVFPALHGPFGEDGTLQGLLEMADVPYVGCGVLASSCGMDKVTMKSLFAQAGLPICKHTWFLRSQWRANPDKILRKVQSEIGLPCFVKPANLGSSVGVSRAKDKKTLSDAIDLAAEYDRKIIVEVGVDAREIEVSVLGNDEPQASLPGEIVTNSAEFYDYSAKYIDDQAARLEIPAKLPAETIAELQDLAVRAFRAIDGSGLARVDFFVLRNTGQVIVNEINTMPGFTSISMYPKLWEASGIGYSELLDRLIELAFERHREIARNETSI